MQMRHDGLPGRVRRLVPWAVVWIALLAAAPVMASVRSTDSILTIERQVTSLQTRLVNTTVAIRMKEASGSGVIVSSDGYVLTAAHVINPPTGTYAPNQKCAVTLADGKTYDALTLGMNPDVDFALIKIEGATNLPVSPIGDSGTLRPGEWIVATGHPLGRRAGRPPVVRLGRVLGYLDRDGEHAPPTKIVTDAPLISGDSGGPLFDLNGRVVGINVMISGGGRRENVSMHTLINLPKWVMDNLKKGETLHDVPAQPAAFSEAWKEAKAAYSHGDYATTIRFLARCETLDPTDANSRAIMARCYARQGTVTSGITQLEEAIDLGYNDLEALHNDRDLAPLAQAPRYKQLVQRLELYLGLPGTHKDDRAVIAAAARLAPDLGKGAVRILGDDKQVALGLVVSSGGDVLTKASELPDGELSAVLSDGRRVRAKKVSSDPNTDVALLHVDATGLEPVRFAEGFSVGQWTVTPDGEGSVVATGVIGVASMPVKGRGIAFRPPSGGGFLGIMMEEMEPEALKSLGLTGGVKVTVQPEYPASKAGVQNGDIIIQLDSQPIGDPDDLMSFMGPKKPGDQVMMKVARGKERVDLKVVLGERPANLPEKQNMAAMLSGPVSKMQGPFTDVLHHDTVLRPSAIGGPLLDCAGRCVGMNIARADRTSTYALPARTVQQIYHRLLGQ